jgi:hypothetical protein
MSLGAYEFFVTDAPTSQPDPVWPTESLQELVQLGFVKVGRFVNSAEHPIILQLLGRV